MNKLLDYIQTQFKKDDPIFIEDLLNCGMSENAVRQALFRLQKEGKIEKYDTGIYYLSTETIFGKSTLSADEVIVRKYIENKNGDVFGYVGGYKLANMIGLTSQVPYIYEIYTNKASSLYREVKVGQKKIIIKKTKIEINKENAPILQFLDAVTNAELYSELDFKDTAKLLNNLLQTLRISSKTLEQYLSFYPDKIYKMLYNMEVIKNENS